MCVVYDMVYMGAVNNSNNTWYVLISRVMYSELESV